MPFFFSGCFLASFLLILSSVLIVSLFGKKIKHFFMSLNLDGGFRNETRRMDRKTYFENLEDLYVYLCFSFGNNPVCRYAYAVEIEPWKKALHWCYVFNDPRLMHEYGIDIPVCDDKTEGLYVPKEQACDLVDYVQVKLF